MILSDISVKRPVFAAVVAILLTLAGIVAAFRLSVRELPEVDPPVVSIETVYRGAAASVVENRITQVIEERISGIAGVESISSTSFNGRSTISVEFSATRDVDSAANDVRDRVSTAIRLLPQDADPPEIRKVDADEQPIMFVSVLAPGWSLMEITDYADRYLVDRFAAIDGVARVQFSGETRPAMRVWLDRARLAAYGLTVGDVQAALERQNLESPAGRLEGSKQNLTVRLNRSFSTPEQFRGLVVARGSTGYLVRLGDVAKVEIAPENPYNVYVMNGVKAIGLGIVRQSGANTLDVANQVKAEIENIHRTTPPGMKLVVGTDSSQYIAAAIDNVWRTLGEAVILVVLVIYLFLGSARATLIPAITVPICLTATFIVLWAAGMSINLLTLLALVLAIGLVVDDAIIVLENIYHRIEQGEPPLLAAFRGSRQVAFAVVATTAVVCAVFVPVMFIAGNTGLLFRELAVAMVGAIIFSGFVALSLTPMLCSKILKRATPGVDHRTRFARWIDTRFERLAAAYGRGVERSLRRPLLTCGSVVVAVAFCFWLGAMLSSELAPGEDQGQFTITATAPQGTSFPQIERYLWELNGMVKPLVDDKTLRHVALVAPMRNESDDFSQGRVQVFTRPWNTRDFTTEEAMKRAVALARDHPAVRISTSVPSSVGGGRRGQPVQFVIAGDTYENLVAARDALFEAARSNPGLVDLDSDYKETLPQILVDIDTARAGDLGVPIREIGTTLETLMGSRRTTTYIDRGQEYYVMLQAGAQERLQPSDLTNVYVRSTTTGQLVALSSVVRLRSYADAQALGHYNKVRAVTITASLAPGYTLGQALDWLDEQAVRNPDITQIGYKGESLAFRQTGSSLMIVFGLTIIIVYLVLAAQFESFVHPAVIILTAPLALAGGLLGLWVMGGTLNIYSQVGIIMLVGLAAKNGILIVEFANQLRDEGRDIVDAVIEASRRRLRPILMTSIAMVAGAIPLMLAHGAGAGARRAIGTTVVWGVTLATVLTLIVIPIVYAWLARRTTSAEAVARELEAQAEGHGG
jgi:multidrug efflux pump